MSGSRHRRVPGTMPPEPVPLPVMQAARPVRRATREGRRARWRIASLTFVWALMTAHVLHWAITGRSVAPFVMSDSTRTLEAGEINPGFVLFAASILVAMLLGRFLCGWVCHVGALQDLCAWLLRRAGMRPHLFRSRALAAAPYLLAGMMFVWPAVRRDIAAPAAERWWPGVRPILGTVHEFPGFTTSWMTTDLWAGLPSVWVAVPFLALCGFVTVYLLGARGLCRYGCPYGGLLRPVQSLAPWTIRLDPSRCDGCGLCTAACTSGVRVLEETRTTGRVVSRECIRSLDCVDACPHGALSFAPGLPAVASARSVPARTYDTTLAEDAAMASVGLWTFFATRGLYGQVPMLMAVTLAVLASFTAWKTMRLIRARDARLPGVQLKRSGSLRWGGIAFLSLGAVLLAALVHSTAVQVLLWRAGRADDRVTVPREDAMSGDPRRVPESARRDANAALALYARAGSISRGGIGLADTPSALARAAWLNLVIGEPREAERILRGLVDRDGATDTIRREVAVLMLARGDPSGAEAWLRSHVSARKSASECREMLCSLYLSTGRPGEAEGVCRDRLSVEPGDVHARCLLGVVLLGTGRASEGLKEIERAAAKDARDPRTLDLLASAREACADVEGALEALDRLARRRSVVNYATHRAAQILDAAGRHEEAQRRRDSLSAPSSGLEHPR